MANSYGLDKLSSTATYTSVFRTRVINVGQKFDFEKIRIPLASAINANTTITMKIFVDDGSSSTTMTTINNTNYPSKRKIIFKNPDLNASGGENNFFLEFTWSGTTGMPISLPIIIDLELHDDEQ